MSRERYQLGREIARGGMGRVVEAVDTVLGRTVALKEALAADSDSLRRFAREIRITARLEHPAIVPVHDAGVLPGGQPFYVMRKISGKPLETLVAEGKELTARLALVPHIVAAAHAVAHAHERGVVHRDIKPSNILAGGLGETILIDWGLAKVMGEPDDDVPGASIDPGNSIHTRAGIVYGTPGFLAPEQLKGAAADIKSDVYALGATLYHVLARKPPHHAKTAEDMLRAASEEPAQPIAQLEPGVPAELATIVDKSLSHDRDARYATAQELAEDLQRFLTGQLVAAHRYSSAERLRRFVRRNLAAVVVSGAATAALVAVGTYSFLSVVAAKDRAVADRDRADDQTRIAEEQTEKAKERADQLAIERAQAIAKTNPTLAVALLKPFATTERSWRHVRAIAEEARLAGVAYGYTGPARTLALDVSGDGTHALALGDDGSIRVYDLKAHTVRELPKHDHATDAKFAGDAVAIASGKEISLIGPDGTEHGLPVEHPIAKGTLATGGSQVYWLDPDGAVWHADASKEPAVEQIPAEEPAHLVAASPEGVLAIGGSEHLFVVAGGTSSRVIDGDTTALAWGPGGELAAIVGDQAIHVATTDTPSILHKATVGARTGVALGNHRVFVVGPTGVGVASRDRAGGMMRKPLSGYSLGVAAARGDAIVTASPQGGLAVLSEGVDKLVPPAGHNVDRMAASPGSPYVVTAGPGQILAWDLDDVLPRRVLPDRPLAAGFVGDDGAFASYDHALEWVDLAHGHSDEADAHGGPLTAIAGSANGKTGVTLDLAHHARAIRRSGVTDLAADATAVTVIDDDTVAVAAGPVVRRVELTTGKTVVVATGKADVVAMAVSERTVDVAFADATLWHAGAVSKLPAVPTTRLARTADGLAFGAGSELYRWTAAGGAQLAGRLPVAVAEIAVGSRGGLFAVGTDGTAYAASSDPAKPERVHGFGARPLALAVDAGLYVGSPEPGALAVYDPIAGAWWPLAGESSAPFDQPRISPSGNRVLAVSRAGLLAWTLDLPARAADLPAWLDGLTNATAPASTLEWKP